MPNTIISYKANEANCGSMMQMILIIIKDKVDTKTIIFVTYDQSVNFFMSYYVNIKNNIKPQWSVNDSPFTNRTMHKSLTERDRTLRKNCVCRKYTFLCC